MRLGINLLSESPKSAGPRVYAQNLLKSLAKLDNKNRYFIFVSRRNLDTYYVPASNFEYISIRFPDKIAIVRRTLEQVLVPILARKYKTDLLHSINNVIPLLTATSSIVTILDVTSFKMQNRFGKLKNFYLRKLVPYSSKKVSRIIAISKNTEKEIVKYCNVEDSKIDVIYIGVSSIFKYENSKNNNPYILYVGTLEPGKNIKRIIEAFAEISENIKNKLVIAGRKGWMYRDIFETTKRLGLTKKVVFKGYVPYKYLPDLYYNASVFVFPSLHEGFGLPVLEAMACGTPVITSNTSSLPEVAGEAAILVNPHNTKEIADAIENLLSNEKLRKELISKGIEQVKLFSWEKCARETLKVYEKIYNKK